MYVDAQAKKTVIKITTSIKVYDQRKNIIFLSLYLGIVKNQTLGNMYAKNMGDPSDADFHVTILTLGRY